MARAFWGKYLGYSFVDKGACTHKIGALLILQRVILFYTSIIPYIEYISKLDATFNCQKLTVILDFVIAFPHILEEQLSSTFLFFLGLLIEQLS